MRISDWSSDVCSSDLQARRLPPAPAPGMVAAMIAPLLVLLAAAQAAAAPAPSDPIAADWKPIPDDELMVMTLGDGHRVVIRLASASAPAHVANLKRLAKARWWDGEGVYDRKGVVSGKGGTER